MFGFLFNVPPDLMRAGEIELAASWQTYTVLALLTVAAVLWVLGYARLPAAGGARGRGLWMLVLLRGSLLALVLFALLEPQLVVPVDVPTRGRVAVLVDDSLSMRVADQSGATRAAYALDAFAPGAGTLAAALEDRFDTAYYRFAATTAPFRDAAELSFAGGVTDLAGALRAVQDSWIGASPHAVVVVTDGCGDATLSDALDGLRAHDVPVHVVGVGSRQFTRDLELNAVRIPARALAGDTIEAEVTIQHRGFGGQTVQLTVEDDSLIVAETPVVMPQDRNSVTTRLALTMKEPGLHEFVFRLPHQHGETLAGNNTDRLVVNVRDGRIHVLHVEGEPRFEVKFARRAVSDDSHIRLVSLVRTSDNKRYRLGVESPDELADGFPITADALFPFHVVILGSVEAARFNAAQQQLLVDFVGRRGGGLLLLGGRRSFAEGRYGESALSALMPVTLDARADAFSSRVQVTPTDRGFRHVVLRNLGDEVWSRLPPLNVVNPVRRLKPGAELLLGGHAGVEPPLVVLATQRYGRGTVAALPVRDTWRWQMHGDVAVDDQSHEILWRQLLRWLARPAEGRVRVDLSSPRGAAGQPVSIAADVVDAAHQPLSGATVRLRIETPLGERIHRAMDWQPGPEGRYQASFTPTESGRYDLEVALMEGERVVAADTASVYSSPSGREFYNAELDAPLLERLALETGGRYYPAAEAAGLPDAIDPPTGGGRTVVKRNPLWNAPVLYLLIVAFAGTEWFLRRRWRLR